MDGGEDHAGGGGRGGVSANFVLLAVGVYFLGKAFDRALRGWRNADATPTTRQRAPADIGGGKLGRLGHLYPSLIGSGRADRAAAAASACAPLRSSLAPVAMALAVAWLYWGAPVPWTPTIVSHLDSVPSDQWFDGPNATRYQLHVYGEGAAMRAPVLDCAHYPLAVAVAAAVLPSVETLVRTTARDPSVLNKQLEQRHAIEAVRALAAERCLVDGGQLWAPAHAEVTAVLERAGAAAWLRASRLESVSAVSDARVHDVLVARDGTRFMRVWALVAPNGTTPASSSSPRVERRAVVLAEGALLAATRRWHATILERAKTHTDHYPCLCVAHFGIVGSGLHLHYEDAGGGGGSGGVAGGGGGSGSGGSNDLLGSGGGGSWHLWSEARLVHENVLSGYAYTNISYLDFLSHFPGNVHALLNMSGVEHYTLNTVEYVELAALLDGVGGDTRVDAFAPFWLLRPEEITDATNTTLGLAAGQAQLLAVLNAHKLAGGRMTRRELRGAANVCFVYCRRAEERLMFAIDQ